MSPSRLKAKRRCFSPLGFSTIRQLGLVNVQQRATGTLLVEPEYGSHPTLDKIKRLRVQALLFGAQDRNRTGTRGLASTDFKSVVSTYFTTRASGYKFELRRGEILTDTTADVRPYSSDSSEYATFFTIRARA